MADRSAAGQAAGYHFQIQRGLLSLLAAGDGAEVSIESLDDIALLVPAEKVLTLEQLKHSVSPGPMTDRSRPLWKALDAWMDLVDDDRLDSVDKLLLVASDRAEEDSAAALLRSEGRSVKRAEQALLAVAREDPGPTDTSVLRKRFDKLPARKRGRLLAKIEVQDGSPGVGDFRDALREQLGSIALPGHGVEDFLHRIVGWWERRAVDLLLGRRSTVPREELVEEIVRLRDQYSVHTLPAPDPELGRQLADVLAEAYAGTPFVRQLELIAARDERIQVAVEDYHRAYAQRGRWLEHGILAAEELVEWEDALFDEWRHAWNRMLDDLDAGANEGQLADAGKALLGELERSDTTPLRDRSDRFLHVGTLHGMADIRRVGWHPAFKERLAAIFGEVIESANTAGAFARASP